MSTSHPKNMRRLKGRVVWFEESDTANLSAAFPHGGHEMGTCRSATFLFGIRYSPIVAEEFGGASVEYVYMSESAVFSAVLRDYADDMVSNMFLNGDRGFTTAGVKNSESGMPAIKSSVAGTVRPGSSLDTVKTGKLLFVPDDVDNHEFLVMYKAVPMIHEASEMRLTAADWAEIGVVFHAVPDSAGKLYQFGRKSDISLT